MRFHPNTRSLPDGQLVVWWEVVLHDALTGDAPYRLVAGVGKREKNASLRRLACTAVDFILGKLLGAMGVSGRPVDTSTLIQKRKNRREDISPVKLLQ